MKQRELITELLIVLPFKRMNKYQTSYYRLLNNIHCPKIGVYLKECRFKLIEQLDMIINDNSIDLCVLREYGLLATVKGGVNPSDSASTFERYVMNNYEIKMKVINNILFAINLIDYHTNNNT